MKINNPAATPNEGILAEALTAWKRAFDQHRPEDMVRLFSRDALFQGLSPTLLTGRKEIFDCFAALPPGIKATFQIIQARQLAQGLVCGFAALRFTYPDARTAQVQLSLVLSRDGQKWLIAQYHASRTSQGKKPRTSALAAMMNPFAVDEA
ncbi:YybH family protein [Arthrobacter sp. SAFR-014]|uniref:YybH family protein n=1 Tax=unclassified Arthrobacter TaxID=235627 RepID=UPI003F7C6A8F